jgi:hypothetical protein
MAAFFLGRWVGREDGMYCKGKVWRDRDILPWYMKQ